MLMMNENVDAETPDAGRADREVAFMGRFKLGGLAVVHDGARQFLGMHRGQRLVGNRGHLAVHLKRRREAGRDEQVGGLLADHAAQQVMYQLGSLFSFHNKTPYICRGTKNFCSGTRTARSAPTLNLGTCLCWLPCCVLQPG